MNIKWTRYGPLTGAYTAHRQEKVCRHINSSEEGKNVMKGAWMPLIRTESYHSHVDRLIICLLKKQMLHQLQACHLVAHRWYMWDKTLWVMYVLFKTGLT